GGKNNQEILIQLLNQDGIVYASFHDEHFFIDYWLKDILQEECNHYLIIDKQRVYYPVLQNWNLDHVFRICCIHSTHVNEKNDKNQMINSNYKEIFDDLSNPEAVVVLTNNQKIHIEERFLPNENLYCIPHSIEAYPNKVEFNERKINSAVYLARFSPEKQHKSMINVFQKVVEKIPDAELHLYGTGRKKKEIKNQIKKLQLNNN